MTGWHDGLAWRAGMAGARRGHRPVMTSRDDDSPDQPDQPDLPTTDHPLHGEPRPWKGPALGVLLLVLAVVAIFALITLIRYVAP